MNTCSIAAEAGRFLRPGLQPGWKPEAGMRHEHLREGRKPEERVVFVLGKIRMVGGLLVRMGP